METSSGVEGVGGIGMHVNDLVETSSFLLNDLVAYIRCRCAMCTFSMQKHPIFMAANPSSAILDPCV